MTSRRAEQTHATHAKDGSPDGGRHSHPRHATHGGLLDIDWDQCPYDPDNKVFAELGLLAYRSGASCRRNDPARKSH